MDPLPTSSIKFDGKKLSHLRLQTKILHWINAVLLSVLALSLGALVLVSAIPQKKKLAQKQQELANILEQEHKIQNLKKDAQADYDALREDPEYLELQAIDRLNLYKPGTTIYRISHDR